MPKNVSDHLPVQAQINIPSTASEQATKSKKQQQYGSKLSRFKVKWTDLSKEDINNRYTIPLEEACKHLWYQLPPDPRCLTAKHGEQVLEDLTDAILSISRDNLPHSYSSARKLQRPEWSKEVDVAYLRMKQMWKVWKDKGRPKDRTNSTWKSYKEAKRIFRRKMRRSRIVIHNNLIEEIEASQTDDPQLFSRLVRENTTASKSNLTECIVWDDVSYSNQEILKGWETYFRSLSTLRIADDEETIAKEVHNASDSNNEDSPIIFNSRDLHTAIQALKPKKAGGLDQVAPEHLLHLGPISRHLLLTVMNTFCRHTHVPQSFKRGIVIPIHKGKGKPLTDPGNYRGITLTSVFCKVFELLLKPGLEQSLLQQGIPDNLQSGFQKDHSCIMTALSLNLVIQMNSSKRLDTHIALLDATKAFDTVWHNGLFHKLLKAGIKRKPLENPEESVQRTRKHGLMEGESQPPLSCLPRGSTRWGSLSMLIPGVH